MAEVGFKQVITRGCGLDVHKNTVVATIDGEGLTRQTREFSTTTSSLIQMSCWLQESGVTHAAIESTGVYWKPVYNVLEPTGINVWVVNARHVKYVPGHKTDRKDSAWLCKLLLAGLLRPSYIPPREQRELRDLTRYRKRLVQDIAAGKNRTIRILEDCNIKLASVLSDTSGATATRLIDKLCDGAAITLADVHEVYHGKLSATPEEILEACTGFVTAHHVYMLQTVRRTMRELDAIIQDINRRIKGLLAPYGNVLELLREIPGLGDKSAEDLVAEIGLDMGAFPTEHHLASWAGMCPGSHESAGKKKAAEQRTATSR